MFLHPDMLERLQGGVSEEMFHSLAGEYAAAAAGQCGGEGEEGGDQSHLPIMSVNPLSKS